MTGSTEMPDMDPLLLAVGRGIQAFSAVEDGVTSCFGAMLGDGAPFHHLIHDAVRGFEMKLKTVDAIAPYAVPDELSERWRQLSAQCRKRAQTRHHLAHWTVAVVPTPKSVPSADDPASEVLLVPARGTTEGLLLRHPHLGQSKKQAVTLAEVRSFTTACIRLYTELTDLAVAIRGQRQGQ